MCNKTSTFDRMLVLVYKLVEVGKTVTFHTLARYAGMQEGKVGAISKSAYTILMLF